ncbi:hypothetical protein CAOG_04155, partial [Capsaspora owczarzaki ATCC 30864]
MSAADVVVPALKAACTVFIMAGTGVYLARRGVMNERVVKGIGEMVVHALMPCMLFAKVVPNVSVDTLDHLWPLLVYAIILAAVGMGLGAIAHKIVRASPIMRNFMMATIGFANATSIPLALFYSVAENADALQINPHDTAEDIQARGSSYILIYTIMTTLMRWTVADQLLTPPDDWDPLSYRRLPDESVLATDDVPPPYPSFSETASTSLHPTASRPDAAGENIAMTVLPRRLSLDGEDDLDGTDMTSVPVEASDSSHANYYPPYSSPEVAILAAGDAADSPPQRNTEPGGIASSRKSPMTMLQRIRKSLNPPIYAAIVSVIIGMISPIRELFFPALGSSSSAPLNFITDAVHTISNAVVPLTTMMLGAELSSGPMPLSSLRSTTLTYSSAVALVVAKLFIMPVLGTLITLGAHAASIIPDDPAFRFVMMLESCAPSAINLIVMCSLHSFLDKELSTILFYMYILSAFTMTGCIMVFLTLL